MKLGLFVDDLRLGARAGIDRAASLGLDGIHVGACGGELHPDSLAGSGRRDLARLAARKGLALVALGADAGEGLADAERNNRVVPEVMKHLAMARDIGAGLVTTRIGRIGEEDGPERRAIAEALTDLARQAEHHGVELAAEVGADAPERLARFLTSLALDSVKVAYDPGTLAMRGWEPAEGVRHLAPWIVHAYARDGRFGRGEVPLGEGEVPWREYLAELVSRDYPGFQIIRTGADRDRLGAVVRAAEFLRGI